MSDQTNTRLLEDCAKALQNTEGELAELKRRFNQERRLRESLEREKADLRRSEHFAKTNRTLRIDAARNTKISVNLADDHGRPDQLSIQGVGVTLVQWTKEAERATQLEDRVMALSNQLSMQGDSESKLATLKERVAVVTRMNNEKTARIKALEDSAEKKDQLVKEWSRAIEVYESEVQRVH